MKKKKPKNPITTYAGFLGIVIVFLIFNAWLSHQIKYGVKASHQNIASAHQAKPTAKIPAINPDNDLLAPVDQHPITPHDYLKRRPQENSDKKDFDFPQMGPILTE